MTLVKKIQSLACSLVACAALAPALAVAAPGDNVYASGGSITIRFVGSDAGYDSLLQLWIGGMQVTPDIFPNHSTAPGTEYTVPGSFLAGTLLDIQLKVVTTGNTWHTGPASGNADGKIHADVVYNYLGDPTWTYVGFEDVSGGGDMDYNDHMFAFTNTAAAVPEPETYAMMLAGLGLIGFNVRRRKTKAVN
jgi:hypothetical protein